MSNKRTFTETLREIEILRDKQTSVAQEFTKAVAVGFGEMLRLRYIRTPGDEHGALWKDVIIDAPLYTTEQLFEKYNSL